MVIAMEPQEVRRANWLGGAKAAFTTRRVALDEAAYLLIDTTPHAGDVVLARVSALGQHSNLQLTTGRRAKLYVEDEIIVAYGNRYAPDQFEAWVPDKLGACHLAAGGGIAARVRMQHSSVKPATALDVVGILADVEQRPLNLRRWALPKVPWQKPKPLTLAVMGTSMNAGKTHTVASLAQGYVAAGKRVGVAKVTGTGAGGDLWAMADVGVLCVLDFTDAGYASTYGVTLPELLNIFTTLTHQLYQEGADVVLLEIADGLLQQETSALMASPAFASSIDGVIFAAGDAMGASAGVSLLQAHDLPVLGVSGALTQSPLATREAEAATSLPVWTSQVLRNPEVETLVHTELERRFPDLEEARSNDV